LAGDSTKDFHVIASVIHTMAMAAGGSDDPAQASYARHSRTHKMSTNTNIIEEYISLPLGKTFIRWDNVAEQVSGNDDPHQPSSSRPVLLMLHGATVPSWQFDALIPELIRGNTMKHYRVLSIDLYGHGRSARPNTKYNLDLFVTQVIDVIDQCCVGCQHIIGLGHSMGSAVLAHVASIKEHIFRRLILVAPMLDYKSLNPFSRLLSVPVVGEALMQNSIVPTLKKRRMTRYSAIGMPELGHRFINEIESRDNELSFGLGLLRMFRHGAVGDQTAVYRRLGDRSSESLKIHVMWGSEDNVANEKQILQILCQLGKVDCIDSIENEPGRAFLEEHGVTFNKLDGLEHNLLLSHPKICADDIIMFLNKNPI
jgi:pimeloyl-ACP methyl ester carboxylesterase